jgi:molybdenum cofactor guanylyltransferase
MARGCQPVADAAGFVLAGGQSRRMGIDKALLEFGGRPLVAHAIAILAAAGLPASIAGAPAEAREALAAYAPVIADAEPGLGPLSGVCAALASTTARFSVFVPVDVPWLPPSLIAWLLGRARITDAAITLASVNGMAQTFPAVVSRRVLPALEHELRGRRLGCLASFKTAARELGEAAGVVSAEVLVQAGQISHPEALPVVRWFLNLNTRQDMRLALSQRAARVI